MKLLLAYATNSGSTEIVAQTIVDVLIKSGLTVTLKQASDVAADELSSYDGLVIGSPSWDDSGNEGQPLPAIMDLIKRLDSQIMVDKPVAIFGLGDKSYTHFCGAVDVLEQFFSTLKTRKIIDSLRIDNYYCNPDAPQQAQDWALKLASLCR